MATSFGTASTFGLTFETGIITDSIGYSYTQENKALRNGTGDITGKTYYNEQIEVSIAGYIPTTSAYSTTLAALITLATAPTDYLVGSLGTKTIVESITRTHTVEDYQRIEVTAMHHPLIV
jgi:hypothetical protein